MAKRNKALKEYKFGLAGNKKKIGINYWRFFFNGVDAVSGSEQMFFIELEMINPWLSPSEVLLGFKPRIKLSEEDLQYALAGTQAAHEIDTETLVRPSFCSLRVGMLGVASKQLCYYFPLKEMKFSSKPFEIEINNKIFSEDKLSGFINVTQEELSAHPELLCDSGYVNWDLKYETQFQKIDGYKNKLLRWFPFGLKTDFTGKISFDGSEYIVDTRKCSGYVERFWGDSYPETWFHVSSSDMTSLITGKTLRASTFAIQGIFENKVSFTGSFEGIDIDFYANASKRSFSVVWDCTQMPESENVEDNLLHWSVSVNNKLWIVDVDIYCKIKDLYNRTMELPVGNREVLNLLEGATGFGEIKIYKRIKNTLEQIEHVKLTKVICEYGHTEVGNL